VFEYHLRRQLSIQFEECESRIYSYYQNDDVRILGEDCLKTIIEASWGYVLDFINGLDRCYLYHELDGTFFGYDRCAYKAAELFTDTYLPRSFPPIPQSAQWRYISSATLPQTMKHGHNPPLEELV